MITLPTFNPKEKTIMKSNPWIRNLLWCTCAFALLAILGSGLHGGAGIRPAKKTKWQHVPGANKNPNAPRYTLGTLNFVPVPSIKQPAAQSGPDGYLTVRGPVDLSFAGPSRPAFDRSKIIYQELQLKHEPKISSTDPVTKPPGKTPPPAVKNITKTAPVVSKSTGESSQAITADTTEPTLQQLLENARSARVKSQGTVWFNNKVDGLAPSRQEILAPFIIPWDANPPMIHIKGKATYIRE